MNTSSNNLFIAINYLDKDNIYMLLIDNDENSINIYKTYYLPRKIFKNVFNLYKVSRSSIIHEFNQI